VTDTADVLGLSTIALGERASNRHEAIDRVGALLADAGYITTGYVAAMHERESIISTYLGNGIALPHGTSEAQDTILRTGIAVAQYPDGVPWGDEPARLVIGLAARSEEHIAILSRLAAVLEDADLCATLATTTDAGRILDALTGEAEPSAPSHVAPTGPAETRMVRIANPHGLHARPAAQVVERAMAFDAAVTIAAGERVANALSITQVIALGANTGEEVTVSGTGDEAAAAVDSILEVLLSDGELP